MQLHSLPKITDTSAKIRGRGIGSGKGGHTTGRGTKGQKGRGDIKIWFEGTKNKKALIKRLPFLRGKGKFKAWSTRYTTITTNMLENWPEKIAVTTENLIKAGLISKHETPKLVGGSVTLKGLKIEIPMSKQMASRLGEQPAAATEENPAPARKSKKTT